MTIDIDHTKTDDGCDEMSQFQAGLITGGEVSYFKLGEGGWVNSPLRTDVIALGDSGKTYSGIILVLPIVASTLTITADPSGSPQAVTDDGAGNLTGSGSGTINYKTGAWSVTFGGNVTVGVPIQAEFNVRGALSATKTTQVATGDGTVGVYEGVLEYKGAGALIEDGTVTISDGGGTPQTVTDTPNSPYDGEGTLSGDGSGTINYETGEVSVQFTAAVTTGNTISATYKYGGAAKAPVQTKTDLESASDPDLYTFQKTFDTTTGVVFAGSETGRSTCKVYLDLFEGIDDGNGDSPYYFEGGLFSANDVLLVYFTFTKSRKTGGTRFEIDVPLVI